MNNAKLMRVATDVNHGNAIHEGLQSFLCIVPYVCMCGSFATTQHNDAVLEICIREFHMPKALFCGNINAVLQIVFGRKAR